MANRMPSMIALLGLLAVAGYQHRDKIGEMLKGAGNRPGPDGRIEEGGLGGILSGLGGLLTGENGSVTGGLGDLLDRFKQSGHGQTADSWIKPGPNEPLSAAQVADAVGEDNIAELSRRTGLSRQDLLDRLSTTIPEGVDRLTPGGHLPNEDEARRLLATPDAA